MPKHKWGFSRLNLSFSLFGIHKKESLKFISKLEWKFPTFYSPFLQIFQSLILSLSFQQIGCCWCNWLWSRSIKFKLIFDILVICVDNRVIVTKRRLLVKGDQTWFDLWVRLLERGIVSEINLDGWAKSLSESQLIRPLVVESPIRSWQVEKSKCTIEDLPLCMW